MVSINYVGRGCARQASRLVHFSRVLVMVRPNIYAYFHVLWSINFAFNGIKPVAVNDYRGVHV